MKICLQPLLREIKRDEKQKMSSLRSVFHQLAPYYNKGIVGSPDTLGSLDLDNASGLVRMCKCRVLQVMCSIINEKLLGIIKLDVFFCHQTSYDSDTFVKTRYLLEINDRV